MPILIDFGAARDAIAEESKNISSIVKEGYSSPEQYTINNKQNASSDIYALGAVFYRLITGKVPTNAPHRQTALLNDDVDPIGDISKEYEGKYSPQLLHAVKKALNIRAIDRFSSVSKFQNALTGASIVDSRPSPTSRHMGSPTQQNSPSNDNDSSKTGLVIAFVIVLALLLAGIGYVYMEQTSQDKTVVTKTIPKVVPPVSASVDTKNEELEQAKKELAELKRKQVEAEQQRKVEAERKEQEAEAERLRKEREEREEIEKLKEEKASAQREELARLRREKAERERQAAERVPKEKVISFNENGIDIRLTYPSHVRAGQKFRITADMTNSYGRAKQGGLTLSFPDMRVLVGTSLQNNFSRIDGYSYPQKIWNKQARKALPANYFVVEGWQSRPWAYGKTKHFTVELTAPTSLNELKVNVRGVLWIKNKHNLKVIPSSSYIYDQQGFAVKQFSIKVR
jgi:hypothetical protein